MGQLNDNGVQPNKSGIMQKFSSYSSYTKCVYNNSDFPLSACSSYHPVLEVPYADLDVDVFRWCLITKKIITPTITATTNIHTITMSTIHPIPSER